MAPPKISPTEPFTPAAHSQGWKILELFVVGHLVCGFLLEFAVPLGTLGDLGMAPRVLGAALVIAAAVLIAAARRDFRRHAQPTDPGQATTTLIVTGTFGWSRNPLSVATLVFLAGLGLLLANLWMVLLVPATAVLVFVVLIHPEEEYLARLFGDEYRAYCARVARWILF